MSTHKLLSLGHNQTLAARIAHAIELIGWHGILCVGHGSHQGRQRIHDLSHSRAGGVGTGGQQLVLIHLKFIEKGEKRGVFSCS